MSIREYCEKYLIDHGLWPNEAKSISSTYEKLHKELSNGRFDDQIDGYPNEFKAVVIFGVKHEALEWLKNNSPKHFAIQMLK